MFIAVGYDSQDDMALVPRRTRHVAQRFLAAQPDAQHLARLHALQPQLGADEGHGADLAGDVDRLVRLGG